MCMKSLMKKSKISLAILAASTTSLVTSLLNLASAAELEEIVITSEKIEETIPQDLARYGNRIEVITADQIEEMGFVDLSQTLQMAVPGLHIRPKNGAFDYIDLSLQGSRKQEVLVTIDGVRITNRLYNGTMFDTVPVHMIERIEVLKGGQGIFYGTQAVGGVINIVTKSFSNDSNGQVSVGVNSNEGYDVSAYYRGSVGKHQFVAYASKDQSDGYTPYKDEDIQPSATQHDRGYDVSNVGLKYAFNPTASTRLSVQYQHTDADLDFARPYLNYSTVNARDEDIFTAKFDWQLSESIGLYVKAYQHNWDTLYTRLFNTLDANGMVTGAIRTINDHSYWGYEDYGFNAMVKINSNYGLEYIVGYDQQNFSGSDEVWRIGDQEETVNAGFVQLRTTQELMENTSLALGIRRNSPSKADDSTVWNVTGKHHFTDGLYFRGNVGTAFRLPDIEELFLNEYYDDNNDGVPDGGWFAIGNPELKPEKSTNINLAIGGILGNLNYELIGFDREITDYIDSYVPVFIAGVEGEGFVNSSDKVEMRGAELLLNLAINNSWSANLSYITSKAEFNGSGDQLRGIPKSEIKFQMDFHPEGQPFGVVLAVDQVGEINERSGFEIGDYTLVDLSGHYYLGKEEQHRLTIRVENLGDEEYETSLSRGTLDATDASYFYNNIGLGRTLHASYSFQF